MKQSVIQSLESTFKMKVRLAGRSLLEINGATINLRTATQKAGSKYWFDVTPSFYSSVNFFLFACGSASTVYVFPTSTMKDLLEGASLGGQKQVPNFTIFTDTDELEPAGAGGIRNNIGQYLNAFGLIL